MKKIPTITIFLEAIELQKEAKAWLGILNQKKFQAAYENIPGLAENYGQFIESYLDLLIRRLNKKTKSLSLIQSEKLESAIENIEDVASVCEELITEHFQNAIKAQIYTIGPDPSDEIFESVKNLSQKMIELLNLIIGAIKEFLPNQLFGAVDYSKFYPTRHQAN
jgi:hypothetical protein